MATPWTGTKPGTFVDDSTAVPLSAANMNAIVDTLNDSVATVRNLDSGKILHLSADGLPEYPDSTAGTTYLQSEWATTDSWSGTNCALLASGGTLKVTTSTTASTYMVRNISYTAATKNIIIRIRGSKSGTVSIREYNGSTLFVYDITATTAWATFSGQTTATGSIISVYVSLSGFATAGDWIEIDWMYIGDGTYATKLSDVSGNGNDATVYGAIPVDGIAGKALRGDGTNDYLQVATLIAPANPSMSVWIKTTQSTIHYIGGSGSTGAYGFLLFITGGVITLRMGNGSTTYDATYTGGVDGLWHHIAGTYDSTNVRLYVDGVLRQSTPFTGTISYTGISYTRFLQDNALTAGRYFNGDIDDPRIYNRALSAAEVWELYQKPSQAGGPVNGTQIGNLLGYTPHIDGESPSLGTTFAAKIASGEYTYPASCTSAPTTNAGNVIVNSGAVTDTFLAFDGTTNIAYRGYRAHGTGAPTWIKISSSGSSSTVMDADAVSGCGIGALPTVSTSSLLGYTRGGKYSYDSTATNQPAGLTTGGTLEVIAYSDYYRTIVASPLGLATRYVNTMNANVWGGWSKMWDASSDGNGGQPPAPKPQAGGGTYPVGSWVSLTTAAPNNVTLPNPGGAGASQWSYWICGFVEASGAITAGTYTSGVALAGGTLIGAGTTGRGFMGFAWRTL